MKYYGEQAQDGVLWGTCAGWSIMGEQAQYGVTWGTFV
jgi:hypothetical protein